jgi:hypothetical protein
LALVEKVMSIFQKFIAVLAVLTVTACATPTEVRSESPKFSIENGKDAKIVAACISDKLMKYHRLGNTITTRITAGGYVVQYDGAGPLGRHTGMVLEVIEIENGKSKSIGHFPWDMFGSFVEDAEAATRDCSK